MGKGIVDFTELPADGELWEMFARDFLLKLGFFIENQPNRGPDGGKDLLVTEQLSGFLNKYRWRWLVSCKHYANSNKSVSEVDEINIQERVDNFNADGFLGFYSTIPSSGLNSRLEGLKANGRIQDFRVFDSRLIENYMIRIGFSDILMRYFPLSYKNLKPVHALFGEFIPLTCPVCGKEIIESLYNEVQESVIVSVIKDDEIEEPLSDKKKPKKVIDIYWACKGNCDEILQNRYLKTFGATTEWEDISDIMIPVKFLQWIFAIMNEIRDGDIIYSDGAFEKEKRFIMAMSQRVLREMTEEEYGVINSSMEFHI